MPSILKPNMQDTDRQRVQLREDEYRSKQQIYHDKRHQACALPSLTTGQQVWVRDQNREGQILGATKQPRSYLVKTEMNTQQRNWSALVPRLQGFLPPSQRTNQLNLQRLLLVDQQQLCQPKEALQMVTALQPSV